MSVRVGFWGRLGGLDGVSSGVDESFAGVGSGVGGCVGSGMSSKRWDRDHSGGDEYAMDLGTPAGGEKKYSRCRKMRHNIRLHLQVVKAVPRREVWCGGDGKVGHGTRGSGRATTSSPGQGSCSCMDRGSNCRGGIVPCPEEHRLRVLSGLPRWWDGITLVLGHSDRL